MVKYGFCIKDNMIFDTQIKAYSLKKKVLDENVIYYLEFLSYKRLHDFEPLLYEYELDRIFEILNHNSYLRRNRKSEKQIKTNKLHYISNMATIYNYPPTYLTQKRFSVYKICQSLKKRIQ